ncbi:phage protein Gp37 [Undibacterium sp.]|uniref:phage protein Gp37 n=1 Tax=Undibacterium sp. TaxID=1914977 RepID=UPI0025F2D8A3|nr:phage protein Gp37 [Undibacterium sp.]
MLAAIETAIINRIKAAAGLSYLRSVESYGGQFDDDTFDVVRILPAVWVTFAGSAKPVQHGANAFLTPVTFAVMCCARSVRSEETTRHDGPAGEVGVYRILKDVKTLLLMQDLGLDIDHLRPGATRTLYNTNLRNNGLAVFAQEWHTKFSDDVPAEANVTELLHVGLNYRLKPGDDLTDAADTVTFTR